MISKNKLKYLISLNQKKFRQKYQKFIADGLNSVEEGLKSTYNCEAVFCTEDFEHKNSVKFESIKRSKIEMIILKNTDFLKISNLKSPQGIAAIFQIPAQKKLFPLNDNLVVYLDNINDPGNLGTIIRTCNWFGVKTLMLSEECAEYTNPKVVRSSTGSIFHVNIFDHYNIEDLKILKSDNYQIFCSDLRGENIYNIINPEKLVLILSNEAHGPSNDIIEIADKKISIPKSGNAESLNVAIAAGIILSHFTNNI